MRASRAKPWTGAVLLLMLTVVLAGCPCPPTDEGSVSAIEGEGSVPPSGSYVKVKAIDWGSGGVMLSIDVKDPENGTPYTNHADISGWTGTGSAPTSQPTAEANMRSANDYDLAARQWAGGSVVDATGATTVWAFIHLDLIRTGEDPAPENFVAQINVSSVPTGWIDATKL